MIEIPVDHGGKIAHVVLAPVGGVVVFALMVEPHIPAFVNQKDTKCVTCLKHGAGAGVMRGADGIKACILEHADTPPFTFIISCSTKDAAVVMDTATAEQCFSAVDKEALT